MISFCNQEYSSLNQEDSSFGFEWQNYNSSYTPNSTFENIYTSFQFTKSSQIKSYPYLGLINTYLGGGYLHKMTGDSQTIRNNLKILESLQWIDRQTAAIFVEFTLYNPNLNLYQFGVILFEIISTGSCVSSADFRSIDMNNLNNTGLVSFKILMYIVYLIFIIIFMVKEIKDMIKLRKQYFYVFYNYIDLLLIGFSWAAFIMFLYLLINAYDVNNLISKSKDGISNAYINLQYMGYLSGLFNYFIGFCAALGTIRFIKLLRFNKRIILFIHAFKLALSDLIPFSVVFLIYWVSFVQMFNIMYNVPYYQFSSFVQSFATTIKMVLGQETTLFLYSQYRSHAFFLGPILYVSFIVTIVFVWTTVFLTIINDNYAKAKFDETLDNENIEMFSYIKSVIYSFLGIKTNVIINESNQNDQLVKDFEKIIERYKKVTKFRLYWKIMSYN